MSSVNKLCALTFDDGPCLTTTSLVLDWLSRHSVPATFFLVGSQVNVETAAVMKRAIALGCELQNHSWSHAHMGTMDMAEVRAEVLKTSVAIQSVAGTTPAFFRPPYFEVNDAMFDAVEMPMIAGTSCLDWDPAVSAEKRAKLIIDQAKDGSIFLLHDFAENDSITETLDLIFPALEGMGFSFVTLSDLFARKGIDPTGSKTLWYTAKVGD